MTENELRLKPVNVVKGWLGLNRADRSHKAIIDTYNSFKPLPRGYKVSYTDNYCATTISSAAIKAGLTDIIPRECSCGKMVEMFKKMGRWKENDAYVPKVGDVIFYNWGDNGKGDCTGWPDHVGYVAAVNGNKITVIEGNKAGKVAYRTVTVNARYIRGYGIPDYASKATVEKPAESSSTSAVPAATKYKVTTNGARLALREAAGTSSDLIKYVPNGTTVTGTGKSQTVKSVKWIQVKVDGKTGWMHSDYLKKQ